MSADARVKSFIDRILRLKEEQDALSADIRDIYAEAKGEGYNKTAMGELVAYLRKVEKKGAEAIAEQQGDFDLYLEAYQRASGTVVATHVHAREEAPASASSRIETAGETPTPRPDLTSSPDRQAEASETPPAASANHSKAPQSNVVEDGQPGTPSSDARPAQNDDATSLAASGAYAKAEVNNGQSEQAVASFQLKKHLLRPHCQNRDLCSSGTSDHCHSCKRAMAAGEAA